MSTEGSGGMDRYDNVNERNEKDVLYSEMFWYTVAGGLGGYLFGMLAYYNNVILAAALGGIIIGSLVRIIYRLKMSK